MSSVLDASALLAYLREERGADVVADAIAESAHIGAVNWAETLSKLADAGHAPREAAERLRTQGILDGLLQVEPLTPEDAVVIAELRQLTRSAGLSLADRACLAVAARLALPVLTADRAWTDVGLETEVRTIR